MPAFSVEIRNDDYNKRPLVVYGAAWPLPIPATGETVFFEYQDGSYAKPVNAWKVTDVHHFYTDDGGHKAVVMVEGQGPQVFSIADLLDS